MIYSHRVCILAKLYNQSFSRLIPTMGNSNKPKTALAAASEGKAGLIAAYMARHAEAKKARIEYCYRHHPDHAGLLPDKWTMLTLQEELHSLPTEDCEVISHMWSLFAAAPSRQRQIILRGMLSRCCFPQLSDVSAMVHELVRIDFITSLPIELSFKILQYLDARSLSQASMVNHHWKKLADDDVVWYHLCEQHIDRKCTKCGWGLPLLEQQRLRKSKRAMVERLANLSSQNLRQATPLEDNVGSLGKRKREHLDSDKVEEDPTALEHKTRPWKDIFIERYKLETNWRTGKHITKQFQHSSPVLSLQFDEQYLITGTYDGLVHMWDVETMEHIKTLSGHFRGVSALKFDAQKLVTGSWDQSVRVWCYHDGQCLCTFRGHEAKVLCIDFDGNLIAAGSSDSTIKIWDFVEKSCFTLRGHTEPVHSVRIHNASATLYTSSEDLTVRMWDLRTKNCIKVFGGPDNGPLAHIAQIQYALPITLEHLEEEDDHHHLIELSPVPNNGAVSEEITNSDDDVKDELVLKRPTHLLTASLDNTIKLWDIASGKCARTLFGHVEGVWCIAADHFRIVSGAHDKLVKVWDLQSGKCWHTFSGHTRPVCCVGLTDTGFASGGDDGLVKIYSFDV